MLDRLAGWVASFASVVQRWPRDRVSRHSLELRIQALHARHEDDARRLRKQEDEILRLRAIAGEHAAQAAADAAEDARIRQAQAEIRRLSELRRSRGAGLRQSKPSSPAAPERINALLQALRESLERNRPD